MNLGVVCNRQVPEEQVVITFLYYLWRGNMLSVNSKSSGLVTLVPFSLGGIS